MVGLQGGVHDLLVDLPSGCHGLRVGSLSSGLMALVGSDSLGITPHTDAQLRFGHEQYIAEVPYKDFVEEMLTSFNDSFRLYQLRQAAPAHTFRFCVRI